MGDGVATVQWHVAIVRNNVSLRVSYRAEVEPSLGGGEASPAP